MVEIQSPIRLLKRMTGQKQSKPDRDREWSQSWAFILVEGYCFIDTAWSQVHDKYHYQIVDWNTNPIKTKRVPNQNYDPTVKRRESRNTARRAWELTASKINARISVSQKQKRRCVLLLRKHMTNSSKKKKNSGKKKKPRAPSTPRKARVTATPRVKRVTAPRKKGVPHGSGKPRSRTEKVRKERHGVVPDTRDEVPDGGVGNQSK